MAMTCISGARECCGCMACLNGSATAPDKNHSKIHCTGKRHRREATKIDIIRIKPNAVHCTTAGGKTKNITLYYCKRQRKPHGENGKIKKHHTVLL